MRGLLMIEELYNQTVNGFKTQTRRDAGIKEINDNPDDWFYAHYLYYDFNGKRGFLFKKHGERIDIRCNARYRIGEVLYLKEPYIIMGGEHVYMFDLSYDDDKRKVIFWKNKLFMPATAARAYIRITGIKCEKLLDISEEDCILEGIKQHKYEGWENYDKKKEPKVHSYGSPKKSFISLFRYANKMSAKADIGNPWGFSYSFEYLEGYKP